MTSVIISRKWISKPYEDFENRFESRHSLSANHHNWRRNHHTRWPNKFQLPFSFPSSLLFNSILFSLISILFIFIIIVILFIYFHFNLFLVYFILFDLFEIWLTLACLNFSPVAHPLPMAGQHHHSPPPTLSSCTSLHLNSNPPIITDQPVPISNHKPGLHHLPSPLPWYQFSIPKPSLQLTQITTPSSNLLTARTKSNPQSSIPSLNNSPHDKLTTNQLSPYLETTSALQPNPNPWPFASCSHHHYYPNQPFASSP
jgi:hypothetical protein